MRTSDGAAFESFERSAWRGRAPAYDRGFARLTAHTVEPLLDRAGVGAGTRMLDIGCGPGSVTGAALARGALVTSADAEASMAKLTAARHPEARVHVAVLPELPFADQAFDAVVGNFVINHTGDPAAAVAELCRVLRPGGTLALTCWRYPGMRANRVFGEAIEAAGVPWPADVPHDVPFSPYAEPEPFAGLLAGAGLETVRTETLSWEHHVDPAVWWDDVLSGAITSRAVINRQPRDVYARIRAAYDRIVAEHATGDGGVALPAHAVLAHGTRPPTP